MTLLNQIEKNPSLELPEPSEFVRYLAPAVMEVLGGVRPIAQLGGMVTEDIYQRLKSRAAAGAQDRFTHAKKLAWPNITVGRIHQEFSRPNVAQCVILLEIEKRTRAVAIRLEGFHGRWIATAITVL